jgi:peptidyl-tRNA hydrolase, PTH1 family
MEKTNTPKTILIIGLGNPGAGYYSTRHSAGFMVVDAFAGRHEFPEFEMEPDGVLISKKEMGGQIVILAKPQMFMNNSGKALAKFFSHLKIKKNKAYPNLWVINDDLDIPQGKIKIAKNRGAAGHKGVQSIIDNLKTKNFVRFRVGIAPLDPDLKKIPGDKLVLKKLSPAEQTEFDNAIDLTIAALDLALSAGLEKSMTEFNQ